MIPALPDSKRKIQDLKKKLFENFDHNDSENNQFCK